MQEPKILWRYKIQRWGGGPTPAVGTDGSVYFAPCQDTHIYALNADGKELWRYCYEADFDPECERSGGAEISVSPNGQVVVVRHGQGPQGDKYGFFTELLVLEKTGKLAWNRFWKGAGCFRSAAIGSDGTIYFGSPSKKLCALDPSGKLKWEFKAGGKLCTTPRVGIDGTIYVGAKDKKIYSVKADGTKNWDFFVGGAELGDFSVGPAGDLLFATFDSELVILSADGKARMKGARMVANDPPVIRADGTMLVCSTWEKRVCSVGVNGTIEWSYFIECEKCSPSMPLSAADGSVLIQPRIATGPGTCEGNIIAIGSNGRKLWEVALSEHATHGLTLTRDGILYVLTVEALYAIQCPSGLADAPWPMDAQNPQRTSCANPKFSKPIEYGATSATTVRPVEISSTAPSKPLPEKPFTREEVLQELDGATDIPMLDNGFVYPAATRLSVYRDAAGLRWALVIEVVGWNNHGADHEAIQNTLYCFGNGLNIPPGLTNDSFLHMTRDGEESSTFDDQDVDAEARSLYVREKLIRIPRARKRYKELGIELEEPGVIKGYELLRALVVERRELLLATEAELRARVPVELELILRLEEWRHPDMAGSEKPSQTQTFQMLADVLVSGDVKQYQPKAKPNTHWKQWPMGGQL